MSDIDLLADTTLREQAVAALDRFIQAHGCPVGYTQITGLRQLADNEPHKVPEFANKQKERSDKRYLASNKKKEEYASESHFWELVMNVCNGTQPRHPWSLLQARDAGLPAKLHVEKQAPGARLSKEEQEALKKRKQDRQEWLDHWTAQNYPVFFQHFCTHYLYTLSVKTH